MHDTKPLVDAASKLYAGVDKNTLSAKRAVIVSHEKVLETLRDQTIEFNTLRTMHGMNAARKRTNKMEEEQAEQEKKEEEAAEEHEKEMKKQKEDLESEKKKQKVSCDKCSSH